MTKTDTDDNPARTILVFWLRSVLVLPLVSFGAMALTGMSASRILVATTGTLLFSVGGSLAWHWAATSWLNLRSRLLHLSVASIGLGLVAIAIAFTIGPPQSRIENRIGEAPQDVALGNGFGWVTDPTGQTVTGISRSGGDGRVFAAPGVFEAVADGDRLFVSTTDGRIIEIDSGSGAVVAEVQLSRMAGCMTILDGEIWATVPESGSLAIVDTEQFEVEELAVGGKPASIASVADDGRVWFTDVDRDAVFAVDASNREVEETFETRDQPVGIWADAGRVWVGNAQSALVTSIDTETGIVTNLPVPASPTDLAEDDGVLWIVGRQDGTLTAISVDTGVVLGSADAGDRPIKLDVGDDYVWLTVQGSGSLLRIYKDSVTASA